MKQVEDKPPKGPVLGPMIICGVKVNAKQINFLQEIGVKDSKKLTAKKRRELFTEIIKKCDYTFRKVTAQEIDKRKNLNELEAKKIAEIINETKPDEVYVDSPDRKTERFTLKISKYLNKEIKGKVVIHSENKAEQKYLVVAAASIIAKVFRDELMEKIKEEMGEIGSGYPSDKTTINFLEKTLKNREAFGKHIRKTWKTIEKIRNKKGQKKLEEFIN